MQQLPDREEKVLTAINSQSGWVSRSELARLLGRTRLNQLDLQALTALEVKQIIEVDRRPDARPVGFVLFYRSKLNGSPE